MSTWAVVALCGVAMLVGAIVQGIIGIGMALLASPFVALIDPSLVPGTLIVCAAVLPAMTLLKEHHDIDWRGLAWALPFRFLGTTIGAWLVVVMSVRHLGVLMGVVVLSAVGLSLLRWHPTPSPALLSAGALVSGISGTATSVGGPPMALVYQHQRPSMIRCTMAVYFLIGSIVSLGSLLLVGKLSAHQVLIALAVLPFVGIGFAISVWVRPRVNQDHTRYAVLVVCALSAIVLLVRSVA